MSLTTLGFSKFSAGICTKCGRASWAPDMTERNSSVVKAICVGCGRHTWVCTCWDPVLGLPQATQE